MPFSSSSLINDAWVKRGGGWVKCWRGSSSSSFKRIALLQIRQYAVRVLRVIVLFVFVVASGGALVASFDVDFHEAVELDLLAGGAKQRFPDGNLERRSDRTPPAPSDWRRNGPRSTNRAGTCRGANNAAPAPAYTPARSGGSPRGRPGRLSSSESVLGLPGT